MAFVIFGGGEQALAPGGVRSEVAGWGFYQIVDERLTNDLAGQLATEAEADDAGAGLRDIGVEISGGLDAGQNLDSRVGELPGDVVLDRKHV